MKTFKTIVKYEEGIGKVSLKIAKERAKKHFNITEEAFIKNTIEMEAKAIGTDQEFTFRKLA